MRRPVTTWPSAGGNQSLKAEEEERLKGLTTKWEAEKKVVEEILALRAKLREGNAPVEQAEAPTSPLSTEDRAKLIEDLKAKNAELLALQGEDPLILPIVDATAVGTVVGDWTGIRWAGCSRTNSRRCWTCHRTSPSG